MVSVRLIGSGLLLGACSASVSPQVSSARYVCEDGRSFSVKRDERAASILYTDTRYSLPRRPSSIGVRYASPEATLIIDGNFAALVTETIVDLQSCRATA